MSKVSNIDPDKVYDYHTAFDIKPTQVVFNADINANNKKILNVALDRSQNNSVATVGMVKEIHPFTKNNIYKKYFENFYDFTDGDSYGLRRGSSGIIVNSLNHYNHNTSLYSIVIPNRNISDIRKDSLNVSSYNIGFPIPFATRNYTLCIVFYHWRNRSFSLTKKSGNNILLKLNYDKTNTSVNLTVNKSTQNFTMPSSFVGKKIVLWLAESYNGNVTKATISNYSSTLTIPAVNNSLDQIFEFTTEDGILSGIMFSPKFYDFDTEQYHKAMLQEKLNGSYIM